LPVRSYDFLVKDIDASLISGIARLKSAVPLVVGQPPGIGTRLRPIAPELLAVIGEKELASLAICEDTDGVVRRINQRRCQSDDKRDPLALAMAKRLGRQGSPTGMIDYSVGGSVEYTPLLTVLGWIHRGENDKLRALVKGRAVVVASLLPTESRHRLPVSLAGWEPGSRTEPAAVVHIQALRSLLARGLIERAPETLSLLLAAIGTLFWFGRGGWAKGLLLAVALGALFGLSTYALWQGDYLRVANIVLVSVLAYVARLAWEFIRHFRERRMLLGMFAGHVSPQVMRALIGGELQLEESGKRQAVTLMVVGIRGFAARAARSTPQATIGLLNRFHQTAALAIQNSSGAVDKYIGDGLTATFGLPQPLDAPQRNALEAAQDLLLRVARLNRDLVAEGGEPIQIGIGIHSGEVLAGYVGSDRRREFSVIGDVIGIAARLQSLTKDSGHPVLCSEAVAAAVGFGGGLVELPPTDPANPRLWGWTPPTQAVAGAGA
jgi:adenylate cyclase